MTDVQSALLELLKASLFQAEPRFPAQVDWEQVYHEAKLQSVAAVAAPAVPKEAADRWMLYARQIQAKYMRLLYEQDRAARLLESHGVPLVILKGAAAAVYYPVPYLRTMGDIDILTPPDKFEEARRLIEENGYQFVLDDERHIEYTKGGVDLELHRRFSNDEYDIEPILADGMARAVRREIDHMPFPALPTDENGLVLLAHIRHHLKSSGLGLRQIVDWMMFVHAELDDTAWAERFRPLARKAGMETLAVAVTRLCQVYLGLPDQISWCDGADPWTVDMLLRHLFDYGNLGVKVTDRDHPVESMSAALRDTSLLKQLHQSAMFNWPAAQKHPLLWPAAWLYQLGRWMGTGLRVLSRGTRIKEEIETGREKNEFYTRLGVK